MHFFIVEKDIKKNTIKSQTDSNTTWPRTVLSETSGNLQTDITSNMYWHHFGSEMSYGKIMLYILYRFFNYYFYVIS